MSEPRILVVDDDEGLRHLVSRRIERLGHTVDRATDGAEGLELIAQGDYDLIVTDIYMPDVTGLELMEAAKEKDPHTQVIVISASATVENAIEALNLGAFGYLTKPFDHMSALDNAVSRALELRSLILDNRRMVDELKQRADHLEAEVTKRSQQISLERKAISQLLSVLPIGVVVVEQGGKVALTSPMAKKLVEEELRSGRRSIKRYLENVHDPSTRDEETVRVGSKSVQLSTMAMSNGKAKQRKVVILREKDAEPLNPGSLVMEAVIRLKQSLLRLTQEPTQQEAHELMQAMLRYVADLERFMGLEKGPSSDELDDAGPQKNRAHKSTDALVSALQPEAQDQPETRQGSSAETESGPAETFSKPDAGPTESEAPRDPALADESASEIEQSAESSRAEEHPAAPKQNFQSGLLRKGAQIFGEDAPDQPADAHEPGTNGQGHASEHNPEIDLFDGAEDPPGYSEGEWPPPSPADEVADEAEEEGASA